MMEAPPQTTPLAIFLIIFCTLFTSTGQILWKLGLGKGNFHNFISLLNLPFILGFVSYGMGLLLMMLAFKRGEVSVLFPIIATSFVWVSLASPHFFPSDSMNIWKWSGVMVIVASVSVLGFGNTRRKPDD